MSFDHIMTMVVKITNSTRSKAKQHRSVKVLLEELTAKCADYSLKSDGSAGEGFCCVFITFGGNQRVHGIQRGGRLTASGHWVDTRPCLFWQTSLGNETFQTARQSWTVSDTISAGNTFKAKMNIFSVHLHRKKNCSTFPLCSLSVLNDNASASVALDRAAEKYSTS